MLKIPNPEKLNGKIEIDDMKYDLEWKIENEEFYIFSIDQVRPTLYHPGTPDPRLFTLKIHRNYATIDDIGEDIYNNIGVKKIVTIRLAYLEEKVVHMIGLTDIKNLQRFKRVIEGMIIGLNEKIDMEMQYNTTTMPPLSQWGNAMTHSTIHGTW
jgi:hypothetical protein